MKYSANLLLFSDQITPGVLRRFPLIKELGFDGAELPLFDPGSFPVERVRRAAEKHRLGLTASGALPPDSRFYGKAKAPRQAAARYLRDSIKILRDLGVTVFCGPLYKPVGDVDDSLPLSRQRSETVKALRDILPEAEEAGVILAFEPLNRFETNFLNTIGDGIDFCQKLNSPSAGLLLDTFHMHIEEKDTAKAVRAAAEAGMLSHFHASENDRGTAGTGQVRWKKTAKALRKSKYDGWCVLESFAQTNQAIRKAVSCWRPFYPSEKEFLRQGLRFVKKTFR